MSGERTHATPQKSEARPVTKPSDRHEREAERAGDVVARGGTVAGWSFTKVPATPVQRQEVVKEKSDEEKKKEALTKAGEAALETPQGKAVKEKVLADPLVKTVKNAVTSTPGLIATGAVAAGGVAALGAAKKPLPFQPPAIPLDKITPGLSAQVKIRGAGELADVRRAVAHVQGAGAEGEAVVEERRHRERDGGAQGATGDVPAEATGHPGRGGPGVHPLAEVHDPADSRRAGEKGRRAEGGRGAEEGGGQAGAAPPASATAAPPARANVDRALSAPGRPLDPGARRSMEARFGRDFSNVRVHDDARAAATAASIDAAALPSARTWSSPPDATTRRARGAPFARTRVDSRRPAGRTGSGCPAGTGQPLDRRLRAYFEPRLGADLSVVRTYTRRRRGRSAKRLRARAYTVGSDVVFGRNQYEPETQRGRWLVAHELAHVAQADAQRCRRHDGRRARRERRRDGSGRGRPVRIGARRTASSCTSSASPTILPT